MKEETKKKIGDSNRGKKRINPVWNKNKIMKDINPNYVNSMQGKKRPDLTAINKARAGEKREYSKERNLKISKSRTGKKYPRTNQNQN